MQNAAQIELIKAAYEAEKGDPLAKMASSELSGDLKWAVLLRLKTPLEARAWLLNEGHEDTVVVSILSLAVLANGFTFRRFPNGKNVVLGCVLQRVLGDGGSKEMMMETQACYDETYGSLAEKLEGDLGGSLWKAISYWIAPLGPGYFSGSAEVAEGDDKQAVVESWPVILSEGIPAGE